MRNNTKGIKLGALIAASLRVTQKILVSRKQLENWLWAPGPYRIDQLQNLAVTERPRATTNSRDGGIVP